MTERTLLAELIDHAIDVSRSDGVAQFEQGLGRLDENIRIIEKQIAERVDESSQHSAEFQYQIDSLEFEKNRLETALDSAAVALANINTALDGETSQRLLLESRLSDLEKRLMVTMGM